MYPPPPSPPSAALARAMLQHHAPHSIARTEGVALPDGRFKPLQTELVRCIARHAPAVRRTNLHARAVHAASPCTPPRPSLRRAASHRAPCLRQHGARARLVPSHCCARSKSWRFGPAYAARRFIGHLRTALNVVLRNQQHVVFVEPLQMGTPQPFR